jgi:MtN3 and saliva related transmembrane protein
MTASVIGAVAAVLSVASFVPQAWKVIRTRKTDQLSTPMWILNFTGFILWTVYGFTLENWALIVPNSICALLSGFILVMKLVSPPTKHAIAGALDPTSHDEHR